MDQVKIAAKIIKKIIYINVSTVNEDGSPWCSPVYTAFDKDLNFYWTSTPKNVHSENVKRDGKVFAVIYDSTVPEGTGEGVYMTGWAKVLETVEEIQKARTVTQSRKGKEADPAQAVIFTSNSVRKVYRFKPEKIWMNDDVVDEEGNYMYDCRLELGLADLKKII